MTNQQREKTFIHLTQITWIMHHCLIKYIMHAWQTDAKRSARSQIKWLVMSNESFLLKFKFKCALSSYCYFVKVRSLIRKCGLLIKLQCQMLGEKKEKLLMRYRQKIKRVLLCRAVKRYITSKIKVFLYTIGVYIVYLLCVYIKTHTHVYIFKKNMLRLYIKYDIIYMNINIYM